MPEEPKNIVVSTQLGIPDQTRVKTPAGLPDVVITTRSPFVVALVRVARIYAQAFGGMYTLVLSPIAKDTLIRPGDLMGNIVLAAGLALAPAFAVVLQQTIELLSKWDTPKT